MSDPLASALARLHAVGNAVRRVSRLGARTAVQRRLDAVLAARPGPPPVGLEARMAALIELALTLSLERVLAIGEAPARLWLESELVQTLGRGSRMNAAAHAAMAARLTEASYGGQVDPAPEPVAVRAPFRALARAVPPLALPAPRSVGRYEILDELGAGRHSTVFRCRDPMLERRVAVKLMSGRQLEAQADGDAPVERFYREARCAAGLVHPNCVQIYDFGETGDGGLYLVMELVEGMTLGHLLSIEQRLEPGHALAMVFQIADALEHAHRLGVVHRDVKPGNVVVMRSGLAKLLDFGIAGVVGSKLTGEGVSLGSPLYTSPEMINNQPTTYLSDQFSLGVLLTQLLTGRHLFEGPSLGATFLAVVSRPIPKLSEVGVEVPPALQAILDRLLQREPTLRYVDENELLYALSAVGWIFGRNLRGALPRG